VSARLACFLLALAAACGARAQTMLDQEQRLIEVHALLLSLAPQGPVGALGPGQPEAGLELIAIPTIDGTTGGKRQITASDRTPLFPRPRAALGLPMPGGYRAFIGASYLPPIQVNSVSSHQGALEAGLAWAPGPLSVGLRGHLVLARSQSPVTDPATRDTLDSIEYGADIVAGYTQETPLGPVAPWLCAGLLHVSGDFHVQSDGYVLSSALTRPLFAGGVRLLPLPHLSLGASLALVPGRLVHPLAQAAYVF
jgi:hypothetical protein